MKTSIEWAAGSADGREGHSINPFRARSRFTSPPDVQGISHFSKETTGHHCVKISPGCRECYSSKLQTRFRMPDFTAGNRSKVELFLDESRLQQVLRRKKPTGYFWCDMTDIFLDDHPDEWIDKCSATMASTPQHIHMVLTKRPERMKKYMSQLAVRRANVRTWPLPNVYLGVSAENQEYADARIPLLLQTPAAKHFVSYEPALGPVNFRPFISDPSGYGPRLSQIIFGGESGPNARPCNIQWARDVRRQCSAAKIPFFMKQVGALPIVAACRTNHFEWGEGNFEPFDDHNEMWRITLKDRKGGDPSEWPEQDRVREFPR